MRHSNRAIAFNSQLNVKVKLLDERLPPYEILNEFTCTNFLRDPEILNAYMHAKPLSFLCNFRSNIPFCILRMQNIFLFAF